MSVSGVDKVKAKVYLETIEDESSVYQNFRIVTTSTKNLQYFTDTKFTGYHILSEAMEQFYCGNGEDIFFRDRKTYNNLITIIYEKTKKDVVIPENLLSAQFDVFINIPRTTGCVDCHHFRKKNRKCMYYQEIGIETKYNCNDFKQKEKRR